MSERVFEQQEITAGPLAEVIAQLQAVLREHPDARFAFDEGAYEPVDPPYVEWTRLMTPEEQARRDVAMATHAAGWGARTGVADIIVRTYGN